MRIVLFIAFQPQSAPGHGTREPTRGRYEAECLLDVVLTPHLDFNAPVRSFALSLAHLANGDHIFHPGSLLFKLLGAQRNQTLRLALRIRYRATRVTLAARIQSIGDTV